MSKMNKASEITGPYLVDKPITGKDRLNWKLYVDAIYIANSNVKNIGSEVISKLMGVGNQGGFRYVGPAESPQYVVLFTSGEHEFWRDELDIYTGVLLYYGDQRKSYGITNTKLKGNLILEKIFELAESNDFEVRKKIPPVFVFTKEDGRDVRFMGLAVPGVKNTRVSECLMAIWGVDEHNQRFLNYKSLFTILDTAIDEDARKNNGGINLAWLTDIKEGRAFESQYAPKVWKDYITNSKNITPLTASPIAGMKISKSDQLPNPNSVKWEQLEIIHKYFNEQDRGYSFEQFANLLVEQWDSNVVDVQTTPSHKDGGVDGIGKYEIFKGTNKSTTFEFYVQAKCYGPSTTVTVEDTKRLIARIKHRQFGVMITTNTIAPQAYKEVQADGHPIVFITGKDIVDFINEKKGIKTVDELKVWLEENFKK